MVLAKKKPEKDLPEDCSTLRPRLRAKAIPKKKVLLQRRRRRHFYGIQGWEWCEFCAIEAERKKKKIKGKKD